MKKSKWDEYFYTRYKPVEKEWSDKDLKKYRDWYVTWVPYLFSDIPTSFSSKKLKGLELGAGIGAFTSLLADKGYQMTASDVSSKMIEIGSKVLHPIPYIYVDICKPQKKSQYDLVVALEVLEHLNDLDKAVVSIKNFLHKDGWFIGTTPYPFSKNMIDPTHVNVHYPDFWNKLFNKHGFSFVKTYPLTAFPWIWRITPHHQILARHYFSLPLFVSTTVVIAKK